MSPLLLVPSGRAWREESESVAGNDDDGIEVQSQPHFPYLYSTRFSPYLPRASKQERGHSLLDVVSPKDVGSHLREELHETTGSK